MRSEEQYYNDITSQLTFQTGLEQTFQLSSGVTLVRALSLQPQNSLIVLSLRERSLQTIAVPLTVVSALSQRLGKFGAEICPSRTNPRHVLLVHTEAGGGSDESQDGADCLHVPQDRRGEV